MAKTKISEFDLNANNNTDVDGINVAEGMAPSGVNNALRELMSQLKAFQSGTSGDSFNGPVNGALNGSIGATTPSTGAFTTLSASSTVSGAGFTSYLASPPAIGGTTRNTGAFTTLLASGAFTYGGVTLNAAVTGTGNMVLSNSPTLVTPALGTPSSGVVTNLTGTASININGTVGATTANTGAFTTLAASGAVTLSGGTANGVPYLNGSKVLTSGSALTFDGTNFATTGNMTVSLSKSYYCYSQDYGFGTPNSDGLQIFAAPSDPIRFGSRSSGTFTEQMRLTSTGLGIGTSSPKVKLQTVGETSGFPTLGTSAGGLFVSSNNGLYGLYSGVNGSTGAAWVQSMRNDSATAFDIVLQPVGGNLGLGTTSPSASAILDAQSTTKGVRMPNMTTTQKNAIASPAAGLMVFDTTLAKLCVYTGAAWQTITSI